MKSLKSLFQALRPHQWIKNSFVLIGIIFSHQWNEAFLFQQVMLTLLAFCLMASSVYLFNDLMDVNADKLHPLKKKRPLANDEITPNIAVAMMLMLAATGLCLGWVVSIKVLCLLLMYLLLNVAYVCCLKHVVILDVFCIATSFMLRIFAGTYGVDIPPSHWLVLCSLMLTLFLGFAKRRAELTLTDQSTSLICRKVLAHYTLSLLDKFISITAGSVVLTYALYTISPETIRLHNSEHLVYTVAFVLYGMFRYLYLIHFQGRGHDTAHDLLHDGHLLVTVCAWMVVTASMIY